jgi:hypothetical protein
VFSRYTKVLDFLQRILTRGQGWGQAVSCKPPLSSTNTSSKSSKSDSSSGDQQQQWGPWQLQKEFHRIDGSVSSADRYILLMHISEVLIIALVAVAVWFVTCLAIR